MEWNELVGNRRVAVVIPCYKVRTHVMGVIAAIGEEVDLIFCVDDACPDRSGAMIEAECTDPRVRVLYNEENQGVGGAVMHGYRAAIAGGADVIVKVDGDGQMDPWLIREFVAPILAGEADYSKGNRFYDLEKVRAMPAVRLFGNAVLSLMTKFSSGYWNLFDPTNGFTAIHAEAAKRLPFDKIASRYFFESDILFRLNTLRAVVVDVPMDAKYGDEVSNLKISKIVGEFLWKHTCNSMKRIFYNYYLRDLSLASIELPLGLMMVCFGGGFGLCHWISSVQHEVLTPTGTIILATLPLLMGWQLILAFIGYDIASVPKRPLHSRLLGGVKK